MYPRRAAPFGNFQVLQGPGVAVSGSGEGISGFMGAGPAQNAMRYRVTSLTRTPTPPRTTIGP